MRRKLPHTNSIVDEIFLLLFHDVAPLAHVQTVQELTDILVPHTADLLDVGGALRDVLEVVT
ncbi:hypothetical protein KC336_g21062, partial [Hortaea werneckii]